MHQVGGGSANRLLDFLVKFSTFCLSKSMASTSSEAPRSSPRETLTINNSAKTKSNFSIPSYLVANFKAKFCVSKPKPVDNSHHNAASSSATAKRNDHHAEEDLPPSSDMIPNDLLLLDLASSSATTKPNDHHRQGEDVPPSSELMISSSLIQP
ncbi:hypothetical protein RHMOL_Rhmol03G0020700 [Rhododendron molle]|uniref:Uncharacterized protein n=1 Tax=Rhododendron molle TaxID=49168 RepID=A0ACC0P9R5_RHOML|nr:hypothetical protein RHMOL_Rhmol03G0020700 [Rhododendron molle]